MLTKVTLKNFQAHKNLELELGKFTTLTGGSNGGKSAVLRAITALVKNESANDYVRYGQKSLSVRLTFSDNHEVEWIKGGGENKYILTKPDGTSQVFDKVGADVPEEVRNVLKLGPIFVKGGDKEYVNFHNQLESPFLISATPGNVAKLFGELTSASKLYAAVGEGNKRVKSTNALRTTRVRDIRAVKDELTQFNDLDLYEEHLSRAKDLLIKASNLETSINEIESLCNQFYEHNNKITKLNSAIDILLESEAVDFTHIKNTVSLVTGLSESLDTSIKYHTAETKLKAAIAYLEGSVDTNTEVLTSVYEKVSNFSTLLSSATKLNNEVRKLTDEINLSKSELKKLDEELLILFSSLDACPTCYQELSVEAKSNVINKGAVHAAH